MRTGKINGHSVEIYDAIDEMPITRFQKYNKFMLIDSGVGSDLQDILTHIDRAKIYAKSNPNLAVTELDNMKQAIYLVSEEMSPKYLAFAVLVKKLDGKPTDDLSDVGLKKVLEIINKEKKSVVDKLLDYVKKKLIESLERTSRASSRTRQSKSTTTS